MSAKIRGKNERMKKWLVLRELRWGFDDQFPPSGAAWTAVAMRPIS